MKRIILFLFLLVSVSNAQFTDVPSLQGRWTGEWVNTTFNSSGGITVDITILNSTKIQLIVDLDGFVGGMSDPDPYVLNATYDANGIYIDTVDQNGELTGTWLLLGSLVYSLDNITVPGFDLQGASGFGNDDSISLAYFVTFTGGGIASGTADLMKEGTTSADDPNLLVVPDEYALSQNYPNPFNPSTSISFSLPDASEVYIAVYNGVGQKVADLIKGTYQAGSHNINFDATGLSSGVYYYKLIAGGFTQTKKMLYLK